MTRVRRMSDQRVAILAYVQANEPVRPDAVAQHMGVALATAMNQLRALVRLGKLQRRKIDSCRCVWELPRPKPPMLPKPRPAPKPLLQHRLAPIEQAASVWDYARRCV